jgi:ABC-type sugar transport system permease subunit
MNQIADHRLRRPSATRPPAERNWWTRLRRSRTAFSLALMAPALVVITVVIVYPLVRSLILSVQRYELTDPTSLGQWVGLTHFLNLVSNNLFQLAWKTAFIYGVGTVAGQFIAGFACALLLNRVKFRNWCRGVFLLPWVIPPISAALLWWWIFDLSHGVINLTLKSAGLISQYVPWISTPDLALVSVIGATIWRLFPFDMVMLLAGLQTIPDELLDAAAVDGANRIQQFRHIVLPHMRNLIVVILLLTSIWSFQEFTMIWGITQGGPIYATRTLNLFIYQTAFEYFRMGEAAAAGVTWLIALLILSIVVSKVGIREQEVL